MQVFKLNLLIIWKRLPSLSIYLIVFIIMSIVVASGSSQNTISPDLFEPVKTNAVIFLAEDTPLTQGLKIELEKTVNFIPTEDDQAKLTDLLYWEEASYILRVPKGLTSQIMKGEKALVQRTTIDGSAASVYIDMAIEKYLQTASLYAEHWPDITEIELARRVAASLDKHVTVSMSEIDKPVETTYTQFFFNYMAYSIQSILIMGMGIIVLSFKNVELKRRNQASAVSMKAQSFGFIMANMCFGLGTWLILIIAALILDPDHGRNINMLLFILNSLLFALAASAMSYMIGNLIRSEDAIDAVSNVVTLGSSFIGGVFVPQALLGNGVQRIARFTPVYWYVLANNRIADLRDFTAETLTVVWQPMLAVLGFTAVFIMVAAISNRLNRYHY